MPLRKDNLIELLQFMADPTDDPNVAAWYWATALRDYFLTMSIVTFNANATIMGGANTLATGLMGTFSSFPPLMSSYLTFAPVTPFMVTVNSAIIGSTIGTTAATNPGLPFSSVMPDADTSFESSQESIETIASNIHNWALTGTFTTPAGAVLPWK